MRSKRHTGQGWRGDAVEEGGSKTEYTQVGKLKIDDDFSNGWGDCGGVMMTSIVKTRMII